jgi:hypothetical protein
MTSILTVNQRLFAARLPSFATADSGHAPDIAPIAAACPSHFNREPREPSERKIPVRVFGVFRGSFPDDFYEHALAAVAGLTICQFFAKLLA